MDLVEANSGAMAARHPWEVARQGLLVRLLRSAGLLRPGVRVLDVGAGDAWFAARLAALPERPDVVALDPGYRQGVPGAEGVRFVSTPPAERFDVLLLLDVLEHVEDDLAFVSALVLDQLGPSGRVVVTVPAWPALFGGHDRRLGHLRRYTPGATRELLARAGLEVTRAGGAFHTLLPVRAAQRVAEWFTQRPAPAAGDWRGPPYLSAALAALLAAEGHVTLGLAMLGVSLPGLSWWALCRRA